jgi:hypothetical protein
MAAIKETQITLDEHDDSKLHHTAVESVSDSTVIEAAEEGHEMAKVSHICGAIYQCFNQHLLGEL